MSKDLTRLEKVDIVALMSIAYCILGAVKKTLVLPYVEEQYDFPPWSADSLILEKIQVPNCWQTFLFRIAGQEFSSKLHCWCNVRTV